MNRLPIPAASEPSRYGSPCALRRTAAAILLGLVGLAGCSFQPTKLTPQLADAAHYNEVALKMDYPCEPVPERQDDFAYYAPHVIHEGPPEYWDLTLEEALKMALENSPVLRDLGGQVLTNPQVVRTVQGPAIVETDPNIGVEAALSQFDADFSATGDWQNNHRAINNSFFGGGTRLFSQDLNQYQVQLAKRAATGGQYFLRQNTVYDANNAPANLFPSAWDTMIEMEVRQPFLQGAGTLYNRIAGPNGVIGLPRGVLIARVNTDISLAEFELGVRNLISNVENAYWDLYFAYRDLHAKIVARDSALETWRRIHALYVTGRRGGEADKEAQARDQYYYFQAEVEDALTGRLFDGTRTNNGSSGGTFRGNPGVFVTERRLRLTMGAPPNDRRLIRPSEEPLQARVAFDWEQLTTEALNRRAELRRQRAVVKRSELALTAARNFLLPRFDGQGLYRWRGLGHTLLNYGDLPEFNNAYQTLFGGHFQEWQLGAQFDMPIGFRQGHAAVRNAQLMLARERAVLREQELQVIHDLSNSVGDVDRTYTVAQTNYNRRVSAAQQMAAVQAAFEADTASLLDVVESQRRMADADSRYARSMVEYTLAVKNVMFESNTLLENNGINMAEGPWPYKAYYDAARRDAQRSRPLRLSYILPQGPIVSAGPYPQHVEPPAVVIDETKAPSATVPGSSSVPGETVPAPAGAPAATPNVLPDGAPAPLPGSPELPGALLQPSSVPHVQKPSLITPPQSIQRTNHDAPAHISAPPAGLSAPPAGGGLAPQQTHHAMPIPSALPASSAAPSAASAAAVAPHVSQPAVPAGASVGSAATSGTSATGLKRMPSPFNVTRSALPVTAPVVSASITDSAPATVKHAAIAAPSTTSYDGATATAAPPLAIPPSALPTARNSQPLIRSAAPPLMMPSSPPQGVPPSTITMPQSAPRASAPRSSQPTTASPVAPQVKLPPAPPLGAAELDLPPSLR